RAGLPTPPHEIIGSIIDIPATLQRIGTPCVVKPVDSGSSLDVFICKSSVDAEKYCEGVLARHGAAMVEKFIEGTEITVGILEEKSLSPIRITTSREFFDYQAKYVGNEAQHHFDLNLPSHVVSEIQEFAQLAHLTLSCRDLSRVDFIVDDNQQPWLLEINTMPGFTPKSLLPEAAAHDGISFPQLVDRLVCRAYARGVRSIRAAV
ncbi:MAG TPA: ATP-grasp domain-containing protein, partial [Tepidisphaeraceae bacterium]|nr:ATP-grasp domain-containing protein [Tepidisphaeraceae bacterium]